MSAVEVGARQSEPEEREAGDTSTSPGGEPSGWESNPSNALDPAAPRHSATARTRQGAGEPGWSEEPYVEPEAWTFAGWGHAEKIVDIDAVPATGAGVLARTRAQLGQWRATAICGNDITSSVLYVAAICTAFAGVYAPVALAMVGLVLYLFRKIYAEVGSALPLNGGAYNVLLNTTSKAKASLAACLTLLSYIATAVISSTEALHYMQGVLPVVDVLWGTLALLGFFAVLNIVGISESAVVALGIFVLHVATLLFLVGSATLDVSADVSIFLANLEKPPPGGIGKALFFGFAAGMLGISGFESSANFIEEQQPGVFKKTLRNMWVAVFFFNTSISLLALGMLRVDEFAGHQEALLAEMGGRSAGDWFRTWIAVDAFLVLSGAVLTSYVGVTGLVRRMALDRCLPQVLLNENRITHTPHWITLSFFALSASILWITEGNVGTLAGVYTISFLGVMMLFAIGNRFLAVKRGRLPREARATWPMVIIAMVAVAIGLAGNVLKRDPTTGDPVGLQQAGIFLVYFLITVTVVGTMLLRVKILQVFLFLGRAIHEKLAELNDAVARWTFDRIEAINSQAIVFFTRGDGPANLRRAIEYVLDNEPTRNLKIVHVYDDEAHIPAGLAEQLKILDEIFPEIRIDFVAVRGRFGPELIDKLSARLNVPRNYMFIGCPGDRFPHNLADLGGVRLIV